MKLWSGAGYISSNSLRRTVTRTTVRVISIMAVGEVKVRGILMGEESLYC